MVLLFISFLGFKHWNKKFTKDLFFFFNTDSTCAYKSADHLKVHYIHLNSESAVVGKGTGLDLFCEKIPMDSPK